MRDTAGKTTSVFDRYESTRLSIDEDKGQSHRQPASANAYQGYRSTCPAFARHPAQTAPVEFLQNSPAGRFHLCGAARSVSLAG